MDAENRNPSGHKRYTFTGAHRGGECTSMRQIRNMVSFGGKVKLKNATWALLISYAT
jgi:hypothetical protein